MQKLKVEIFEAFAHSNKVWTKENFKLIYFHSLQKSMQTFPSKYPTWGNEGSYSKSL